MKRRSDTTKATVKEIRQRFTELDENCEALNPDNDLDREILARGTAVMPEDCIAVTSENSQAVSWMEGEEGATSGYSGLTKMIWGHFFKSLQKGER